MALPSDALPYESAETERPRSVQRTPSFQQLASGGRAPLEPPHAADAQQLSSANPHEPPHASPSALVQWPATQGFMMDDLPGFLDGMQVLMSDRMGYAARSS